MTPALLETPTRLFAGGEGSLEASRGGLTLEERLQGVWRGLHAHGDAECPVCNSRLVRSAGGGCCGACGSRLS
jgi:hypothetical protein